MDAETRQQPEEQDLKEDEPKAKDLVVCCRYSSFAAVFNPLSGFIIVTRFGVKVLDYKSVRRLPQKIGHHTSGRSTK